MLPAGRLAPAHRPKAPKWSHQAAGSALEEGLGGSNPFVNNPAYMVRAELFVNAELACLCHVTTGPNKSAC